VIARLEAAVLRDVAKILTSSLASVNISANLACVTVPESTSNSSQKTVSSASSKVIPVSEMKSARDLHRHALR
jgi:hypothetical protein